LYSLFPRGNVKNLLGLSETSVLVLVGLDNVDNFLCEISHFNIPIIAFTSTFDRLDSVAYPIVIETTSIESLFFYLKVFAVFSKHYQNK
jgi:ribosomal protein S2